jgi:hypothetical protein
MGTKGRWEYQDPKWSERALAGRTDGLALRPSHRGMRRSAKPTRNVGTQPRPSVARVAPGVGNADVNGVHWLAKPGILERITALRAENDWLSRLSSIDFGTDGVGALAFSNYVPGAFSLTINGWTGTAGALGNASTDRLIFEADQSANLSRFNFNGFASGGAQFPVAAGFEVPPGS